MERREILDLHTHTVASGHAYCTLREMAKAASEKGLKVLGITEHAPKMPGTCHNYYFHNLKVVPRQMYGITLLLGAELNILDFDGNVDLSQRELENLDVVIASIHGPCIVKGTREDYTRAYLKVMENPYVNIIGHPDDSRYPSDYEQVIQGAKKYHKVIEMNNHSLSPQSFRKGAEENDREILSLCKELEVPVVLSSDAHMDTKIGDFTYIYPFLKEVNFPEELILNYSIEALRPYLNRFPQE
ncbi:phosphatase [Blautia sp. An249]|uniref:phosphatase n=1 Tax=Blautia sp. An249 TaxID=1965603 RepID=UPI000B39253A|nr:phosphatase [Blautia sp. An249]OUO80679.1 phosphatase [Blautia sp. An249]